VNAGSHQLTVSSNGLIDAVSAPLTFVSSNQVTLFNLEITANGTEMFVNISAPVVIVRQSTLDIGRTNWLIENAEDVQFYNTQLTSSEASVAIRITPNSLAGKRKLALDQVNFDHVTLSQSTSFQIDGSTMNVSVQGATGKCNELISGYFEGLQVLNTVLVQHTTSGNSMSLFHTSEYGSSFFHNSTFVCLTGCDEFSAVIGRDEIATSPVLEMRDVIIRKLSVTSANGIAYIGSKLILDTVDSDSGVGSFSASRDPISISIRKSRFSSRVGSPAFTYSGSLDPLFCVQLTQIDIPTGGDVGYWIGNTGGYAQMVFTCPSSMALVKLLDSMALNGSLTITEKLSSDIPLALEMTTGSTLIFAASSSLRKVILDASKGSLIYFPTEPMEGLTNSVLNGVISPLPDDITRLKIVWPLNLPPPTPGFEYPLFPYSTMLTEEYDFDSSSILLQGNSTWLTWVYDTVACNPACLANATAICATSDRCVCEANWYGPLCDCDQSTAPPGVFCSIYGGRNWVLEGTMFLPPTASVNLTSSYTLNVIGDMHLDGTVGMNDGTVVVATGIIYSNGKLFGLCKLREFRHDGACVVYSTVSVQSYALEFSNLTEIELILDASDLTTDGSCVPPNPPDALDHLINSTFSAVAHSVMSSNASWTFRIVTGRNETNPQDLKKLSFETKILKSGDVGKSTGSTTNLLASSSGEDSCAGAVNPTGTMTLFVGPCAGASPKNGSKNVDWYIIAAPIIGVVLLVAVFILLVLKVDALRNAVLPYHKSN
jgi:hypothetical protein